MHRYRRPNPRNHRTPGVVESVTSVVVAAVQMTSDDNLNKNLADAADLIDAAVDRGAELVVLPENFAFMGRDDADRVVVAEDPAGGPVQKWLSEIARRHALWIVAGTIPVQGDGQRVYSSCMVYDPAGTRRARYDKIHLFDVHIPDRNERYCESAKTLAGDEPVVTETAFGRLGLAVCYDLRFPEQFRQMSQGGMDILAIPAAFTVTTGAAHWQLLVRARAVENLCPVIAAAQGGRHMNGRSTWGHSMVVNAWGTVIAECVNGPGLAVATLDRAETDEKRAAFPVLSHRRL